ncbi:MAG: hypothetical protein ACOY45_10325 [Pseudomonadota bacterium]
MRAPRQYDTTLDRAGLALAMGSMLGGFVVLGLVLNGGQRDPLALVTAWLIGVAFNAVAIIAVAGPLWLVMHVAGWRRARHAALVGGVTAVAILAGAQTYGFGLFEMPAMDSRTLLYRWLSAIATSAIVAILSAMIGVVMWRIAYRRHQ